jgi:tripartite ATP-independent transporter DctP family solute receptor
MMTKRRHVIFLVALVLVLIGGTMNLSAENVVKIAFTDPPTLKIGDMQIYHPSYAAMLAFKGAFEKYTSGRYTVELYPYGTLGDAASNLEQILSGVTQGATPADGALAPFYKNIQVFSIPYLFDSALTAYDILDGQFGRNLFDDMAKKAGFRVIASYDNGGYRNFSNSKREIQSASDMKNLKIRTMDIPVHMEIVKALGASPTPIAFMELYSALQTGVVDGQENSAVTILGASLNEVQKYVTLDGHLLGLAFLVVGEDWFQGLSPADQESALRAGREASFAARGTVRYAESLAIKTLQEVGVQVYSPTPEQMETFKVAQTNAVAWLKNNIDGKLVDELVAVVESGSVGQGRPALVSQPTTAQTPNAAASTPAPTTTPATALPAQDGGTSAGMVILYLLIGLVVGGGVAMIVLKRSKK